MKLYHQTILPPDGVRVITSGSFTAPRQQELVLGHDSRLALYSLAPRSGRLHMLFSQDAFAHIQRLDSIRLPGTRVDYVLMTSDSGNLSLLLADAATHAFKIVHCEPFGKTGVRRAVPGQYLASDPRGRAVCIAALEKVKLVYTLNRVSGVHPSVSSPLEVHRSNTMTYALASVDVGFENPMFVAIEQTFSSPERILVWYEVDLGLNQMVRKRQDPLPDDCYFLITVSGYEDGPGGIFVCSTSYVYYTTYANDIDARNGTVNTNAPASETFGHLVCKMPKRAGKGTDGTVITSAALYHARKTKSFFALVCSEHGDLLKIDLLWENGVVKELRVGYFDSLARPANSLCIFKSGYLCVALDGGDLILFKIRRTEVKSFASSLSVASSNHTVKAIELRQDLNDSIFDVSEGDKPLQQVSAEDARSPACALAFINHAGPSPTIILASGKSSCGTIRTLRSEISVECISDGLELDFAIDKVFAFGHSLNADSDSFIVVSDRMSTKVLKIEGEVAAETEELGLDLRRSTMLAANVGESSFLQVCPDFVRVTWPESEKEPSHWEPAQPLKIVAASSHGGQLVVALSSGRLIYFELWDNTSLQELGLLDNVVSVSEDIAGPNSASHDVSVTIQQSANISRRATYCAVAKGSRTRLVRISADGYLTSLGLFLAPAPVSDILLADIGSDGKREASGPLTNLLCGTFTGYIRRLNVERESGRLVEKSNLYVGGEHVKQVLLRSNDVSLCLAVGSKPILVFRMGDTVEFSSLSVENFEHASSFRGADNKFGIVAINGKGLRVYTLPHTEALIQASLFPAGVPRAVLPSAPLFKCEYKQNVHTLSGTPRKILVVDRISGRQGAGCLSCCWVRAVVITTHDSNVGIEGRTSEMHLVILHAPDIGCYLSGSERCISDPPKFDRIKVVDSVTFPTSSLSVTVCSTHAASEPASGDFAQVVAGHHLSGTEKDGRRGQSILFLYEVASDSKFKLKHKTNVTGIISTVIRFREMVLVGAETQLQYFKIGIRKLLLKGQVTNAAKNKIVALCAAGGDRVFVGDVMDSVSVLQYTEEQGSFGRELDRAGKFNCIANDTTSRWINTLILLDYSTVCGSDKFGNIFVLRLSPPQKSQSVHSRLTYQISVVASFHVGSSVLSLSDATPSLNGDMEGGKDILGAMILFSCGNGSIGILSPLRGIGDVKFAEKLQGLIRQRHASISGRRHWSHRSVFYPQRDIVDLDLCEKFPQLPATHQREICDALSMSTESLYEKLNAMCTHYRNIVGTGLGL